MEEIERQPSMSAKDRKERLLTKLVKPQEKASSFEDVVRATGMTKEELLKNADANRLSKADIQKLREDLQKNIAAESSLLETQMNSSQQHNIKNNNLKNNNNNNINNNNNNNNNKSGPNFNKFKPQTKKIKRRK